MDRSGPGVPGIAAKGLISFALASAFASFLLVGVSMVTNVERAKFDAVSCWRTNCGAIGHRKGQVVESCPKAVDGCGRGRENSVGTTQRTPPPRCLKLTLAFEVGQTEGNLPGSPRVVDGREALPIIHLLWEVLGSKDSCQGHHHEFNIGDRHASLLCFFLVILHHDNELGDAICLDIVLHHVQVEGDHINGMQPPAVAIKVGHDFKGRDLCIKCLSILQVVITNLVDNVSEEFGHAMFSHLVAGIVVKARFVGGLSAKTDNSRCIVGNVPVIEGEMGRPDELGIAMVGFVLGSLRDNGCE